MKKVAVIGQYGEGPEYVTGQAVKTFFTVNWLKKHFGPEEVVTVNTYGWKKHPIHLFISVIKAVAGCKNVVILPAQHGVKVFAPMVAGLNRLFHRQLFYVVIGGWLAETLKGNKRLKKAVASFDNVCAETQSLARDLQEVGVSGAWYLPNCRDYTDVPAKERSDKLPLRICTYSRVTESKGIADAAAICRKANEQLGFKAFKLEVYGMVDPGYQETFEALCEQEKDIMHYEGVKNADQVLEVLREQFALLFPTFYEGECFAGTVLDAFLSRTPIICNDWKYNSEVIESGVNGFLYPFRDVDAAAQQLVNLYEDPALYTRIEEGCRQSAREYDSDVVLKRLTERML